MLNKSCEIKRLEGVLWTQMEWSAYYVDLQHSIGEKGFRQVAAG